MLMPARILQRLLVEFFDLALGEIEALIAADAHPSVVRYYCRCVRILTRRDELFENL